MFSFLTKKSGSPASSEKKRRSFGFSTTPTSSVPASPRFEWSFVGTGWEAEGNTVTASGMLADDRYAVGSKIVREGKATFTYSINKASYPDAHMFLGVCQITDDPTAAKTYAFNPPTGNLYIGDQLNEHGNEQRKVHLMADPAADLVGKQEGSVVECTADMDSRRLLFAVNGEDPIDCGVKLPEEGVRPWIFMYHEGDSVTIEDVA